MLRAASEWKHMWHHPANKLRSRRLWEIGSVESYLVVAAETSAAVQTINANNNSRRAKSSGCELPFQNQSRGFCSRYQRISLVELYRTSTWNSHGKLLSINYILYHDEPHKLYESLGVKYTAVHSCFKATQWFLGHFEAIINSCIFHSHRLVQVVGLIMESNIIGWK